MNFFDFFAADTYFLLCELSQSSPTTLATTDFTLAPFARLTRVHLRFGIVQHTHMTMTVTPPGGGDGWECARTRASCLERLNGDATSMKRNCKGEILQKKHYDKTFDFIRDSKNSRRQIIAEVRPILEERVGCNCCC